MNSDEAKKIFIDNIISTNYNNGYKWAKYLFHFADIENAVEILKSGKVYSRNKAKELGLLKRDTASVDVLDNTPDCVFYYARLYFRPQTPTQWHTEGFCPDNRCTELNVHIPFPIFFVFNAEKILFQEKIKFSDGNLASTSTQVFSDIEDLVKLPFNRIYHNSYLPEEQKNEIVRNRCAEVIIKDELPLHNNLYKIVCRSEAERETLINILPKNIYKEYKQIIVTGRNLYFRRRFFVDKANLTNDRILFSFNQLELNAKYSLAFELIIDGYKTEWNYEYYPKPPFIREVRLEKPVESYEIKMFIDGHIAFLGTYYDVPF